VAVVPIVSVAMAYQPSQRHLRRRRCSFGKQAALAVVPALGAAGVAVSAPAL